MKTWTTVDKTEWKERGPWDDEPDKAQWIHKNLDCLIVRGPSGALCGYVGVPDTHPDFEKDYNDVYVDCHGGLTFASRCHTTDDESRHIYHTGEVANKIVWWLGFDCSHLYDITPLYDFSFDHEGMYRDFDYVKGQVNNLAEQLVERGLR